MSIWTRIMDALGALTSGEGLGGVFDRLSAPPERTVAFTIAVIALGAKMAKADGQVTRDEVSAFREVFHVAPEDEADAARVFNLARQDVAGYPAYAGKIRTMFGAGSETLCDVMEGLFHIAVADGHYHRAEDIFLQDVAAIFGLPDARFRSLRSRFVPDDPHDPYDILGVSPDMPMDEIRAAWKQLVRETHPDAMVARGLPEEAVHLAERRMVDINRAWSEIEATRG
jgi:DnaJ like chaperone protein